MASITISDLRPAGTDLFQDSESFLHELTEQEVGDVLGGLLGRFDWSILLCHITIGHGNGNGNGNGNTKL
jgi:hypothetical protein